MKNILVYIVGLTLFLGACQKDEIPIPAHTPGEINAKIVEMGSLYPEQIWYDIETGTEISRNKKTAFDLAFECTADGWHIVLNGANRMQVAPAPDTFLPTVSDTNGLTFNWDSHTGNLDSTGIGDWTQTKELYILDRGKDEFGKSLGLAKVMFDSVTPTTFYFRYAAFNGTSWTSTSVEKDSNYVYSYFSFKNGGEQVWIAPPKTEWDLCFTQYTYIYYDMSPVVAYIVTGVLLNPYNANSAQITDKQFDAITLDDALNYPLISIIDNIGWDWKSYDFDAGYYITNPNKNYIFTAKSGVLYKIHFLDWYNQQGQKGTANFEFSRL